MAKFKIPGLVCAVLGLLLNTGRLTAATNAAPGFCPAAGDTNVTAWLAPIRQKFDVPGMAVAIVTSNGLQTVGAVGVRRRGTEIPVTLDDLWHLGSDTKAMTATLIARLAERGQLRWDATMAEFFPEWADGMDPAFRQVTLPQLLSHRAGLPANLDFGKFSGANVMALRRRAAQTYFAQKPLSAPGSQFLYSNLGYILAGAVVEKVTGKSWEENLAAEIFRPLGMASAGFGGTGTPGKVDQPWPHTRDGAPVAQNGPDTDNPPVLGPAGRVHATIQDWAKFVQDQLRGARGEPALLPPEAYRRLHTPPPGGDYAAGWIVTERDWGGGTVLNHVGDNTMNCANVWIAPRKNFAILVCVNQGGDRAFQAADAAVGEAIKWLKGK